PASPVPAAARPARLAPHPPTTAANGFRRSPFRPPLVVPVQRLRKIRRPHKPQEVSLEIVDLPDKQRASLHELEKPRPPLDRLPLGGLPPASAQHPRCLLRQRAYRSQHGQDAVVLRDDPGNRAPRRSGGIV